MEDPAWSLGKRLLASPTIGAMVTAWEVINPDFETTNAFLDDLVSGLPIGKALARCLQMPDVRRKRIRMCLLGDPRVRLPAPPESQGLLSGATRLAPGHTLSEDGLRELALPRALLTLQMPSLAGEQREVAQQAVIGIENYERAAWQRLPVEGGPDAPGPTMRRGVLQFLYQLGVHTYDHWVPLGQVLQTEETQSSCFICGQRTIADVWHLRVTGVSHRRLVRCPCCGVVEDTPIGKSMKLLVEGQGTLRLEGNVTSECWTAGVLIKPKGVGASKQLEWPADSSGAPASALDLQGPWPPGIMHFALFFLWGTQQITYRVPRRIP